MKTSFDYEAASPGANRLAMAFMSPTKKNAEDNELKSLANIDHLRALVAKDSAEAGAKQQRTDYLSDTGLPAFLADQAGAPLPLAKKFAEYRQSGNWGQIPPATPNDDEGNAMPTATITDMPKNIAPLVSAFQRALQTRSALQGSTAANPEQVAKASTEYQGQQTTAEVLDRIRRGEMDNASALNQGGKLGNQVKLYDNIGNTGAVFAPASGKVVADENAMSRIEKVHPTSDKLMPFEASIDGKTVILLKDQKGNFFDANTRQPVKGNILPKDAADKAEKPLPPSAAKSIFENQQNLRRAEQALLLISGETLNQGSDTERKGDPKATGWKGFLPDAVLQKVDPSGVDTRAAIADIGSMVIHDRSGAAVSASEFPRLRPFIPQQNDDPATVKKKLGRFVQEYRNIQEEMTGFYSDSGYKVPTENLVNSDGSRGNNGGGAIGAPTGAGAPTVVRTWNEGGYTWRELSDGTKQRKKR